MGFIWVASVGAGVRKLGLLHAGGFVTAWIGWGAFVVVARINCDVNVDGFDGGSSAPLVATCGGLYLEKKGDVPIDGVTRVQRRLCVWRNGDK